MKVAKARMATFLNVSREASGIRCGTGRLYSNLSSIRSTRASITFMCPGDFAARYWSFVPRFGDKGNKSSELLFDLRNGSLDRWRLNRRRGLMRSLPPRMGLVNIRGDAEHSTLIWTHAPFFHKPSIAPTTFRAVIQAGAEEFVGAFPEELSDLVEVARRNDPIAIGRMAAEDFTDPRFVPPTHEGEVLRLLVLNPQ